MASFTGALLSLSAPIAKKVLGALGMGVISYAGLLLVINEAVDFIKTSYLAVDADLQAILNLFGFTDAIGIVIGAIVARASYSAFSKIGLLV